MDLISPALVGLVMGLVFAGPALALAVSFRLLNFPDLTIEGSFPTGAAVLATGLAAGWPLPAALGAAILAGATLGALTGFIHGRLHVNRFLAGIIVVAMSYTLDLRVMGGPNVGLFGRPSLFDIAPATNTQLGDALVLLGVTLGLVVLAGAVLRSRWGLSIRMAGSNPDQARSLGMEPAWMLMAGLAITNAVAAFSGALLAMYQGFADVGMGQGGLVLALASVTIGEALIPQSRFSIVVYVLASAVIGSVVYQCLAAYALQLGLAATDLRLATAVFVLLVIALRARRSGEDALEVAL